MKKISKEIKLQTLVEEEFQISFRLIFLKIDFHI
jgi:hypothetical protein